MSWPAEATPLHYETSGILDVSWAGQSPAVIQLVSNLTAVK